MKYHPHFTRIGLSHSSGKTSGVSDPRNPRGYCSGLRKAYRRIQKLVLIGATLFVSGCSATNNKLAGIIGKDPADILPTDILVIINRVIDVLAGFSGIVTIILMIAGYQLLISSGDTEGQKRAKDTIRYAALGLLLIVFAYAIVKIIFATLAQNLAAPLQ